MIPNHFSLKISVFHGRMAPEEGLLVGYGALLEAFKILSIELAKPNIDGDIDKLSIININNLRPIFSGAYNKFHGLQILINDAKYNQIRRLSYSNNTTNKTWEGSFFFEIYDNYSLDKNDVLSKQWYDLLNGGFAAWWILQYPRFYCPFLTKIQIKANLKGKY